MGASAGIDFGTSLIKLAARGAEDAEGADALHLQIFPATARSEALACASALAPQRLGLTGGGAAAAAAQLAAQPGAVRAAQFPEFDAWAAGAHVLLARSGLRPARPYLLASVGTGTSALLVGQGAVQRLGGTALGGGTLTGLGALLLGGRGFAEIAALAQRGDRSSVDLYISDIYPQFPPGYTAANFGRAARAAAAAAETGASGAAASAVSASAPGSAPAPKSAAPAAAPSPADIAHALVALVGENVSLMCSALAAAHPEVRQLVFGGATLRHNPAMRAIIQQITKARGLEALLLEDGEFTGALGALTLAEEEESPTAPNRRPV